MQKGILFFLVLTIIFGCKKDPKTTRDTLHDNGFEVTNSVDINITNVAGSALLALNTQTYTNLNQDTFSVSLFKYYISNIKLFRLDGYIYSEVESYHLINQDDTNSCKLTLKNVPLGDYTGMEFIIGVDSLRNCDGAQTGALDPLNDMFWGWSQGYIFAKMEGMQNGAAGPFFQHVGGFSGPYNAIVKSTPSFGSNMIQVTAERIPKLYMKADLLEWFKTPSVINLAAYSNVTMGKKSAEMASNYSDMFSVAAIQN